MKIRDKPIILLVAEAVTLAHFARIVTLAKALDPAAYEIIVASDPRFLHLRAPFDCDFRAIWSIPSAEFSTALAQGKPLYSMETLTRYVKDDLTLLESIKPDLVIGDFRLSLAVSAPLRGIPYAAVVNAYWSPFSDASYPIPDLPMTRLLGIRLAQTLFDIVRPMAFALHARPMNQLRRHFGLPSLGRDLRNAYTWADYTLYADIPEVVPTCNLPANHRYLGPVLWSAEVPLPEWWDRLPKDKPLVFLILGSSGQADLLPMALSVLSRLAITVMVATAGKITLADAPPNAYITDYLPMDVATRRSQVVISNGGSLTTYEALASGVPIIGLCSNMDQLLNMNSVQRLGAGITLRAAGLSAANLLDSVTAMLDNQAYAQAANKVSQILAKSDAGQRLREFVAEILAKVSK